MPPGEVSFWYLAHKIGRRFLKRVANRLAHLRPESAGIWSCKMLERPMLLVSVNDLPVDEESVAFHVLHGKPAGTGLSALRLTLAQPPLWDMYSQVFETIHPESSQEIKNMARISKKGPKLDLNAWADYVGIDNVVEQLGDKIVAQIGQDKITDDFIDRVFSFMTAPERAEMKRRLHESKKKKK